MTWRRSLTRDGDMNSPACGCCDDNELATGEAASFLGNLLGSVTEYWAALDREEASLPVLSVVASC